MAGRGSSGDVLVRHPAAVAVAEWLVAHALDVDHSAWVRAFREVPTTRARIELLHRWATCPRGEPLTPGGTRTTDPANLRRLLTIAYLRGDLSAPDLPPCDPWGWADVGRLTSALGWQGWQGSDLSSRYSVAKRRGDLRIWRAPEGLESALAGFLAGLASAARPVAWDKG
ncbi:MAG: hypothetical protein FJ087_16840 [Deltaproteobacteria bacterium]|nr:hypothetical protein [Deltaproteobacteria bacterium]